LTIANKESTGPLTFIKSFLAGRYKLKWGVLFAEGETMNRTTPQVGAPDPERRTSPIFDEEDADDLSLDLELEAGACYFNDVSYPIGQFVRSGSEVLCCEEKGVWIRRGELPPGPRQD
jgi:hypothetical protein